MFIRFDFLFKLVASVSNKDNSSDALASLFRHRRNSVRVFCFDRTSPLPLSWPEVIALEMSFPPLGPHGFFFVPTSSWAGTSPIPLTILYFSYVSHPTHFSALWPFPVIEYITRTCQTKNKTMLSPSKGIG